MSPINFLGSHFRPWFPFLLLLGSLRPVSKLVECGDQLVEDSIPAGIIRVDTALLCWKRSQIAASARIIHWQWTGELLQDLGGSLHHTFGEAAHQIWS